MQPQAEYKRNGSGMEAEWKRNGAATSGIGYMAVEWRVMCTPFCAEHMERAMGTHKAIWIWKQRDSSPLKAE